MTTLSSPFVYVVDDEQTIREGLDSLLRSVGYNVRCFVSTDDFLAFSRPAHTSCLLLDIRMPGRGGLDLQKLLGERGDNIPIIFLTGHGDVALSVRAMKAGALDFLLKPFHEQTLLDAVGVAIEKDNKIRSVSAKTAELDGLLQTLTPREKEILEFVASGLPNKEIACRLSLAEITIKVHRASGMRKMQCRGVAELVTKLRSIEQ